MKKHFSLLFAICIALAVMATPEQAPALIQDESEMVTVSVIPGNVEGGRVALDTENGPAEKQVEKGTMVTVYAIPYPGYKFAGWRNIYTLENPMMVSINENTTITADFDLVEDVTQYTIDVGYLRINSECLTMTSANNPDILAGSITFDPEKKKLTIKDVEMDFDKACTISVLEQDLTIYFEGNNVLKSHGELEGIGQPVLGIINSTVTVEGNGSFIMKGYDKGEGVALAGDVELTFNGCNGTIEGVDYGIRGWADKEKVIINGSHLTITSQDTCISHIALLETNECNMILPKGAAFNEATHEVESDGAPVKGTSVVIAPTYEALAATEANIESREVIREGQVLIRRNGATYTMTGIRVE